MVEARRIKGIEVRKMILGGSKEEKVPQGQACIRRMMLASIIWWWRRMATSAWSGRKRSFMTMTLMRVCLTIDHKENALRDLRGGGR